ncbi:MAG: helix-turn-helix domain-containing protein [Phycisphaerae bacterium]
MGNHRNVLTTGEVAKICSVAPRTVSKWFDAGQLRGYRIPGSKDRRIPLDQLLRFMRAHGIPLNGLDEGARRVLVLDSDPAFCEATAKALGDGESCEVTTAQSAFEAGAAAQELKPHVLIIDVTLPDVVPKTIVRWCRSHSEVRDACLIGIGAELSPGQGQMLCQQGFDGFLAKPFDARALIDLMEQRFQSSTTEKAH